MSKYGSYRIDDKVLGITHFPDRKQPALFIMKGNVIYPLAYMKEDNAMVLWEWLQKFIEGKDIEL